uniref:Uncharacterized protein n=1 Tax=Oryza glaberrima TaxID=4538 RepID=I1QA82_ORYGL
MGQANSALQVISGNPGALRDMLRSATGSCPPANYRDSVVLEDGAAVLQSRLAGARRVDADVRLLRAGPQGPADQPPARPPGPRQGLHRRTAHHGGLHRRRARPRDRRRRRRAARDGGAGVRRRGAAVRPHVRLLRLRHVLPSLRRRRGVWPIQGEQQRGARRRRRQGQADEGFHLPLAGAAAGISRPRRRPPRRRSRHDRSVLRPRRQGGRQERVTGREPYNEAFSEISSNDVRLESNYGAMYLLIFFFFFLSFWGIRLLCNDDDQLCESNFGLIYLLPRFAFLGDFSLTRMITV